MLIRVKSHITHGFGLYPAGMLEFPAGLYDTADSDGHHMTDELAQQFLADRTMPGVVEEYIPEPVVFRTVPVKPGKQVTPATPQPKAAREASAAQVAQPAPKKR